MPSAEFKYKVPNMYRLTLQYTRFPEQHRQYHHFSPNFSLPLANSTVNTSPGRSVIRRFSTICSRKDLRVLWQPMMLCIVSGSSFLGVHPKSKATPRMFYLSEYTGLTALERRWMILALAPNTDRVLLHFGNEKSRTPIRE